ncbi:MAG: CidA/LrgA family protein [Ectothiorhodospiraceae bacterium]|nr:CidA/LrgA family protein [Ectothiorhodospiraceae bacterium]MCH8503196.1 CidA/LrgA family protein [Ectothiorhodospiraceae bacterium]
MINAILFILLCQLVGEVTVQLLELPFPGPVLGMLLLFTGLMIHGGVPAPVKQVSDTLLRHLALLFVPAGVGLMVHFGLVARDWLPILAGLVGSTIAALAVTLLAMQWLIRRRDD